MRYKNLTITITLGCLSLVVLAGLVMLPITDVISCNSYSNDGNTDNDEEWYLYSDNRTATFSAHHKYPDTLNNLGWSVSANVTVGVDENFCGTAYAFATPEVIDPDRIMGLWEDDPKRRSHTFFGNASVLATVYPDMSYVDGSTVRFSDYVDTEVPKTSLSASAKVKKQRFQLCDLTSKSNSSTTKNGVKFEISVEAEIPASFTKVEATTGYEYEHTDTNGEVWTVSNMREDVDDVFSLGQVVHREARITGGSDWVVALAKVTSLTFIKIAENPLNIYMARVLSHENAFV